MSKEKESKEFGQLFGAIIKEPNSIQDLDIEYSRSKVKKLVELE